MITNFLSTNKNILSNYILNKKEEKKEDNYLIKYKKEQDEVINVFISSLVNNIYKNIKLNKKETNLFLPITNSIWDLWNNAWFLGSKHANKEMEVKFSLNNKNIINFTSYNNRIKKTEKEIIELEKQNKRLENGLDKMNYEDSLKAQKIIENNNKKINSKQEKLVQLIKADSQQVKKTKLVQSSNTRKESLIAIGDITKRRLREESISTNVGIEPLQQSEFGETYLKNRINYLGDNLKESYKPFLFGENGIINKYFKSNNIAKDSILFGELNGLILMSDGINLKNNVEKVEVLDKVFKNMLSKKQYLDQKEIEWQDQGLSEKQINTARKVASKYYDPVINLSKKDKQKLGLNENQNYTKSQLDELKQTILKQNNVVGKVKRLALTELGHAYNLGRLNVYKEKGIELVKLNNSLEHLRRMFPLKYNSIYQKMADDIPFPFKIKGVVCPVCQERAERENGFGKGVYELLEVLSDRQLQLVFHPYCACYYEPVIEDKDDSEERKKKKEKKKSIKSKVDAFFDNNIAKWAVGGTIATAGILGTALMYNAFRKSKPIKIGIQTNTSTQKTTSILPKTNNITSKIIKSENYDDYIIDEDSLNILNKTKEKLAEVVIEDLQELNLPLFIKLPEKQLIELSNDQKQILENTLNKKDNYTNKTIKENINETIKKSSEEIKNVNKSNPQIQPGLQERIESILNKLETYDNYNPNQLTAAERKQIISQYNSDLRLLNNLINNIDRNTIYLYSKYVDLSNKRLAGLAELRRKDLIIPDGIDKEVFINNSPSIKQINNTIEDIENTLRNNYNLIYNEFPDNLNNIRKQLTSNPILVKEYINSSRKTIENNFNKINFESLRDTIKELDEINRTISNLDNITDIKYDQLSKDLETINYLINNNLKATTNLTNIDLDYISALQKTMPKDSQLIIKAEQLKDYVNGLTDANKKLFIIVNKLIQLKNK